MNNAEKSSLSPVFPLDDSSQEEISDIKQQLQDTGFSNEDSEWLVDILKRPDCFGDPKQYSTFNEEFSVNYQYILQGALQKASEPIQDRKNCQTTLSLLFHALLGFGVLSEDWLPNIQLKKLNDSTNIPEWVHKFQESAQFRIQNLDWNQLTELPHFEDLLPFLFPEGVQLNQIVNLDLLNPIKKQGWSSNDFNDPEQLEFWLIWRFKENSKRYNIIRLDTLLQDFSNMAEDVLGNKVLGLINAISYGMHMASHSAKERIDALNDGWSLVAHELIPFLDLLTEKNPELNQNPSSLLKAWWGLSKVIYSWSMGGLEDKLPADIQEKLIESASRHIGFLRKVLRDTPEVFEDRDVHDFYQKAFYVLLSFASPWKRLKALLLVFTQMKSKAVASHLGFWNESEIESPPYPFSDIPLWIGMSMYPQHLQTELNRDPYLQELREEFAKFCLERLKTKIKDKDSNLTDEDFIEPRPAWRQCYVQALKALRVNPGGRGHRTLFWLSNNDPNDDVRILSKKAHKLVRHLDRDKPNLDEGASPRRSLFEAFWWMRQAHLRTLDIDIDQAGAMRTRRKELHRTQEKDDRLTRK